MSNKECGHSVWTLSIVRGKLAWVCSGCGGYVQLRGPLVGARGASRQPQESTNLGKGHEMAYGQTEALMALAGYVDPDQLNAAVADGHHGSTGSPVVGEVAGGVSVDAVAGRESLDVPRPPDHPALLANGERIYRNTHAAEVFVEGRIVIVEGDIDNQLHAYWPPIGTPPPEDDWDEFGPVLGDVAGGHHAVAMDSEPGAPAAVWPDGLVNVWGKLFDEEAMLDNDSPVLCQTCTDLWLATPCPETAGYKEDAEEFFHDFVP